jgi:exonuclease SbcC
MRPEILTIENFGPFAGKAELDFSRLEDIFLITGKTGSGKTSIFDAMCFALYGEVPGSRKDHPLKLRSDHALPGEECSVSLQFTLGEKRYLVERMPKQERKRIRSNKTTMVEGTLVLYSIEGKGKKLMSGKKTEGDAMIRELIGLEADEFFKIVLLPQGEFAEFLRQKSSDRQALLHKLFPLEKVIRVKSHVQKKSSEAKAREKEALNTLSEIQKRFNIDNYDEEFLQAQNTLNKINEDILAFEKEKNLYENILKVKENENAIKKQMQESLKEQEDAEAERETINKKENELSRSRAARPLEKYLIGQKNALRTDAETESILVLKTKIKNDTETDEIEAQKSKNLTVQMEAENNEKKIKLNALEALLNEEKELNEKKNELTKLDLSEKSLSETKKKLEDEKQGKYSLITENEKIAHNLHNLGDKAKISNSIKDIFLRFQKYRSRMDSLIQKQISENKQITELDNQIKTLETSVPELKAGFDSLRREKEEKEQANRAAHLSHLLEAGKPCPVCGSTEHPHPAQSELVSVDLDDKLNTADAKCREAEIKLSTLITSLNAKENEAGNIIKEITVLENEVQDDRKNSFPVLLDNYPENPEALKFLAYNSALPEKDIINNIIKIESAHSVSIEKELQNSKNALQRLENLRYELNELQSELSETEKQQAIFSEKINNIKLDIIKSEEKNRKLLDPLIESMNEKLSVEEIYTALNNEIANNKSKIALRNEEYEKAILQNAEAKSAYEAALSNRKIARENLVNAGAELDKALCETEFSSSDDIEKALLDVKTEENTDKEIRQWREKLTRLETQIAEQKKQHNAILLQLKNYFTEGKITDDPSLETVRLKAEDVIVQLQNSNDEKLKAMQKTAELKSDRQRYEDARTRYDVLAEETKQIQSLENDLCGDNALKLPFDSWLLENYLEEVAVFAAKKLEKMSEGRYSLLLDTERQGGRGRKGLDLTVFDAHTGKTRPCATLSGGESFMASISLALGLAESIQNRSGGVRLDAVFIDEGFGSLDDSSLDKALAILDELRDSRMVGLISHVAELRSRIPCKVEVVKSSSGSKITMNTEL